MLSVIRAMSEAAAGAPDASSLPALLTTVDDRRRRSRRAHHRPARSLAPRRRGRRRRLRPARPAARRVWPGSCGPRRAARPRRRSPPTAATAAAAAPHATSTASRPTPSKSRDIATARASCCVGDDVDRDDLERFVNTQGDCALVVGRRRHAQGARAHRPPRRGARLRVGARHDRRRRGRRHARADPRRASVGCVSTAAWPSSRWPPARATRRSFAELGCEAVDRRRPVHEPERRRARRGGREPRRRRGRAAAQQRQRRAHRRTGRRDVRPHGSRSWPRPRCRPAWRPWSPSTPTADAAGNAAAMHEAMRRVHSAEITHAVRDSEIDGVDVRQGEVIGLVDGRLVASGDDLRLVFGDVVRRFGAGGAELITILTALNGCGVTVADLQQRGRRSLRASPARCRVPLSGGRPAALSRSCWAPNDGPLTLDNTAIVVDSTCDPPPGYFDRPGLAMVPLKVHFGDETYPRRRRPLAGRVLRQARGVAGAADDLAADRRRVHHRLRASSAASYEHVLAFHLSSAMSGTYQASSTAARPYAGVEVYDTRTVSATICLLRRASARAAWPTGHARARRTPTSSTSSTRTTCSSTRHARVPAPRRPHRPGRSPWSATCSASGR